MVAKPVVPNSTARPGSCELRCFSSIRPSYLSTKTTMGMASFRSRTMASSPRNISNPASPTVATTVRSGSPSLRPTAALATRRGPGDEFLRAGTADDARNQGVADHERRSPADAEDLGQSDCLENLLPGAPSPLPRWRGGQGMSRIGGHACRHNERQYPWLNNLREFQSFNGIAFECCRP